MEKEPHNNNSASVETTTWRNRDQKHRLHRELLLSLFSSVSVWFIQLLLYFAAFFLFTGAFLSCSAFDLSEPPYLTLLHRYNTNRKVFIYMYVTDYSNFLNRRANLPLFLLSELLVRGWSVWAPGELPGSSSRNIQMWDMLLFSGLFKVYRIHLSE